MGRKKGGKKPAGGDGQPQEASGSQQQPGPSQQPQQQPQQAPPQQPPEQPQQGQRQPKKQKQSQKQAQQPQQPQHQPPQQQHGPPPGFGPPQFAPPQQQFAPPQQQFAPPQQQFAPPQQQFAPPQQQFAPPQQQFAPPQQQFAPPQQQFATPVPQWGPRPQQPPPQQAWGARQPQSFPQQPQIPPPQQQVPQQGPPQQQQQSQQRGPQQSQRGQQPQQGGQQQPQRGQQQPQRGQQQPQQGQQQPQRGQQQPQRGQQQPQQGQQQPQRGQQQQRGRQQRGPPREQQQPHEEPRSQVVSPVQQVTEGVEGLSVGRRGAGDEGGNERAGRAKAPEMGQGDVPRRKKEEYALPLLEKAMYSSGGTGGRVIKVETNHFALSLGKITQAVHYDVAIEPDRPKKELRNVMEVFRKTFYPKRFPAFDGVKNLYSASLLPFNNQISGKVTIQIDDRDKEYEVTVKFANYVDFSPLTAFFNAKKGQLHMTTPQEAIQCIDIVLRSAPSLACISVGRSFFTRPSGQLIDLGDGMEMYYGFYQSAVVGWKPFLNVDVAHKAFPKAISVLDLVQELFGGGRDFNIHQPLYGDQLETLQKFLRTLKVQYTVQGQKRVYRVNGLKGNPQKEKFFDDQNQREVTVYDYFVKQKNIRLNYPSLPCLWVGSRERKSPLLLPLELCTILGGQAVNRKMNEIQTSNMIKRAATDTATRKGKIFDSLRNANYNQSPAIREFGFSVANDFEKIDARVLDPPRLKYANQPITPAKGVWRADRAKFLSCGNLQKWTIVNLDRRTQNQALDNLADMLTRTARNMGMNVAPVEKPFVTLQPRRNGELEEMKRYFANKQSYDLIIVVISDFIPAHYAAVKQAAELTAGCLTQCLKSKTVFKLNPATVGNILLKVNAKLNGVNHCLDQRPMCLSRPCMIMGADVTHPPPDSQTSPSVAAVTASHESNAFKYNICWRLQEPKLEIIEDLENIVREHLMFFYGFNKGMKPEHIIFFRDGVSEGQFLEVMNKEVQAIRNACKKLEQGYQPSITFLVVQKRHHTRLFPCNPRDSEDRNCNVPAGTCVDKIITHPTAQDFYLVSHASIQGVAKPTKYRTLWDDKDMSDNDIEQLTYYLCHLFTRCNRSVSYPAPTYYAHLAAARAKVYTDNRSLDMRNLRLEQAKMVIKKEIVKDKPMFFV